MKIPVRVDFFAGGLRPILSFAIKSEEPKMFGFINAVIDTGSPTTILSLNDVRKMRVSEIQMQKLTGPYKKVNLGGAQMETRLLPEAELNISGKKIKLSLIQVPVSITKGDAPPTILGIDFLLAGKFKFFFDVNNLVSYLETED